MSKISKNVNPSSPNGRKSVFGVFPGPGLSRGLLKFFSTCNGTEPTIDLRIGGNTAISLKFIFYTHIIDYENTSASAVPKKTLVFHMLANIEE